MNVKSLSIPSLNVIVWKKQYTIFKVNDVPEKYLYIFKSLNEITVIAEDTSVRDEYVENKSEGWRIISFDVVLPFETIGFISEVSKLFAENHIPIMVLSSYSTDHIMIRNEHLDKSCEILKMAGVIIDFE